MKIRKHKFLPLVDLEVFTELYQNLLPTKSGYASVKVNNRRYLIHRLMAIAFELLKDEGQDTVDHIDNDPSNNHIHNLRWATRRTT